MADKAKLADQQTRGEEARRLLDSPAVTEVFKQMEDEVMSAFKRSGVGDQDVREDAHKMFVLLERFKGCLKRFVAEGDLAAKELLRTEEEKKS